MMSRAIDNRYDVLLFRSDAYSIATGIRDVDRSDESRRQQRRRRRRRRRRQSDPVNAGKGEAEQLGVYDQLQRWTSRLFFILMESIDIIGLASDCGFCHYHLVKWCWM
uniref:uncharacterized protein LOC117158319 n=1 Tax=Bombus vancouverensis nearcticus TaxID=2705178 RepID=UPI00143C3BF1|nr:uncharacterized protein LOC117158319 [Bombus vancouverensis nearcticus]